MNFRGQSGIHSKLLQDVGNNLTEENFRKMKDHCRGKEYGILGAGQLEKIKTPSDLFQKLQQKAVFREGDYEKLKKLLSLCESDDAIVLVKEAELQLVQAGHRVEGYPYPGSDVGHLAPHHGSQINPPPYSQPLGGQLHSGYYQPNVPQQYYVGPPAMMHHQIPAELSNKSDAYPSMSQQHTVSSGGYSINPPGNHYNQSNLTVGNQFVAPNPPTSPMQVVSPQGIPNPNYNHSGSQDNDEYYDMRSGGYILFINNYFRNPNGMSGGEGGTRSYEYREGAEKDTVHVKYTCLNHLRNHELDVREEVGKNEFMGILDNAHEKLKRGNYSSFIFIISSHGIQNKMPNENGETFKSESIVLVDGSTVTMDEIKEKFYGTNAPFLVGKPKVFIIQACRGDEYGKGVPDRSDCSGGAPTGNLNESLQLSRPDNADVLEAYATSSGTRAWRNSVDGAWYIKHLCQAINENNQRDHILDLLLKVHRQIAARVTHTQNPAKQMPCYVTTFTKKFRLV